MKVSKKFIVLLVVYTACIVTFVQVWWSHPGIVQSLSQQNDGDTKHLMSSQLSKNDSLNRTTQDGDGTNINPSSQHALVEGHNRTSETRNEAGTNVTSNSTCEPSHQIVFVKTHKTASTTANTVIQRYGLEHNLTFAIPKKGGKFSLVSSFNRKMVAPSRRRKPSSKASPPLYNVIANHARFNKPEMDAVIPHARYLTILRNPDTRFDSVFGYYNMAKSLRLNGSNPVADFFTNPEYYFKKKPFMYQQLKNGMIFTLGLDHIYHDNEVKVERKIRQIAKEFDLVLLTEYFDESLLLMKKLLCWDEEDILYLPKGIRQEKRRYNIDENLKEKILKWDAADVKLYAHLNRTFWQKVEEYGPMFHTDLANFRERQKALYTECVDPNRVNNRRDARETFLVLKKNASKLCGVLMRRVDYFVNRYRAGKGSDSASE